MLLDTGSSLRTANYNFHIHAKYGPRFKRTGFHCPPLAACGFKLYDAFNRRVKYRNESSTKGVSTNSRISNGGTALRLVLSLGLRVSHSGVSRGLEHTHGDLCERQLIRQRLGQTVTSLHSTGTQHSGQTRAVTNGPNFHLFISLLCGPPNTCWSARP